MLLASGTNLYMESLGALRDSRMRDGINSAIQDDLEEIRNTMEGFRADTSTNGMLVYYPDSDPDQLTHLASDADQMALNFIVDNAGTFGAIGDVDGDGSDDLQGDLPTSNLSDHLAGITITRTISVVSGSPHLIQVTYTSQGNSKITTEHKSEMAFPAQSWLP